MNGRREQQAILQPASSAPSMHAEQMTATEAFGEGMGGNSGWDDEEDDDMFGGPRF